MDYDRQKGDENGLESATTMRNNFQELADRIEEGFTLNKEDAAKLAIGATIQINQLVDRMEKLKKAKVGYETDILPKLQAVLEAENDEAATKIAEEKFIIDNNE